MAAEKVARRKADVGEAPRAGLRERNKADKLARIKTAARELFLERGYEETTIREVARRADVGQGTIFAYAAEKRDLVFLVVNDEYERMLSEAVDAIDPSATLLETLLGVFERAFSFVKDQGVIGRQMLRELTFHSSSAQPPQEMRFDGFRLSFLEHIACIVEDARQTGQIDSAEDSAWITRVIFAVYRSEVRAWLSEPDPDLAEGRAALRRSLSLLFLGLGGPDARSSEPDRRSRSPAQKSHS